MDGPEGALLVLLCDDERDVQLRAALSDGADVHPLVAQHVEDAAGDARSLTHGFSHHRQDGAVLLDDEVVHLAHLALEGELGVDQLDGPGGLSRLYREADGRSLDAWVMRITLILSPASAPKSRCAVPGAPWRPVPSRRRSAMSLMDAMPRTGYSGVPGRVGLHLCPREVGIQRVADHDGDVLLPCRLHGGWVHDPGAPMRELHELVVAHALQGEGLPDHAWVRAHDAVHVGPDLHRLGVQHRAQQGGGVVRSASPERGGLPLGRTAYEARDDLQGSRLSEVLSYPGAARLQVHPCTPEIRIRQDEIRRVARCGVRPWALRAAATRIDERRSPMLRTLSLVRGLHSLTREMP